MRAEISVVDRSKRGRTRHEVEVIAELGRMNHGSRGARQARFEMLSVTASNDPAGT
jgi:hypothetical protein